MIDPFLGPLVSVNVSASQKPGPLRAAALDISSSGSAWSWGEYACDSSRREGQQPPVEVGARERFSSRRERLQPPGLALPPVLEPGAWRIVRFLPPAVYVFLIETGE